MIVYTLLSACSDGSDRDAVFKDSPELSFCSAWSSPWVGAACREDSDCGFEGGTCLREVAGFPCGACSLSCDTVCPDLDDFPGTFCTNGLDVGIADAGYCLSKCDPRFAENRGSVCRDGYTCTILQRNTAPEFTAGVCAPGEPAVETACRRELAERGVLFTPVDFTAEHPEGHPELHCDIEDPVFLYSPLNDMALIDVQRGETAPALASCSLVIAMERMMEVARSMGAREIFTVNPYKCRVIGGTSELSMHGIGEAIDILGFRLEDDNVITVFGDWEDGAVVPVTTAGTWLREFTDTLWEEQVFNVILTPDFDDAHDDHFHVDLTPATAFYK